MLPWLILSFSSSDNSLPELPVIGPKVQTIQKKTYIVSEAVAGLNFKTIVKILVSQETKQPKESISVQFDLD